MTSGLEIALVTKDDASIATRDQLSRIVETHDVQRWYWTKQVAIDARVVPHSHPVLTLHTRHVNDDGRLLATFLHEQLHWFLVSRPDTDVEAAFDELKRLYPDAPLDPPEGAGDEESTYLHLIVNYLELEALEAVVGDARAREIIESWTDDHYGWIYRTVLAERERIRDVLSRNDLLRSALPV